MDKYSKIEEWFQLYKSNVISKEEFEIRKAEILELETINNPPINPKATIIFNKELTTFDVILGILITILAFCFLYAINDPF